MSNQERLWTLLLQRPLKQDICFRRSPVGTIGLRFCFFLFLSPSGSVGELLAHLLHDSSNPVTKITTATNNCFYRELRGPMLDALHVLFN